MSSVRLLVGTRKGAFILTADGTRKNWTTTGPLFGGWEVYHLKGSPLDPNRIYASQTSGWFGQIIQRSDDGGKTWNPPGTKPEDLMGSDGFPKGKSNEFAYEGETGMHMHYDGTQKPWEFKRIWHIEPSHTDPDAAYAGAEDAAIFKSTDGAVNWQELPGLRGHGTGSDWQPGAGGMVALNRMYAAAPDGLSFMIVNGTGAGLSQLMELQGVRYDLSKVGHLGTVSASPWIWIMGQSTTIRTRQEAVAANRTFNWSGSGPIDGTSDGAAFTCEALKMECDVVSGYTGSNDAALALTRGEMDAMFQAESSANHFVRSGEASPLATMSRTRSRTITIMSRYSSTSCSFER